jgi:hypothetical protein
MRLLQVREPDCIMGTTARGGLEASDPPPVFFIAGWRLRICDLVTAWRPELYVLSVPVGSAYGSWCAVAAGFTQRLQYLRRSACR